MKKKILLLYTGGTIGMMQDAESNTLKPFPFRDIYIHLPMLKLLDTEITYVELQPLIDSSNTNPDFWIRLAKLIAEQYDEYDGFVILHGTDTMAYTASALSFLLENLNKPVILTGSQLPLGVMRTDGRENILNSVEIATATRNGKPRVPEVCIYFENALYRGNRAYKHHAEQFHAFTSSNYPKLAEVGAKIKYNDFCIAPMPDEPLILHTQMDDNIAILKLYPGITESLVGTFFETPGLRAVIMETYGTGNAPTNDVFLSLLEKAVQKGIIVINVTQCKGGGGVETGLYETSRHLRDIGVVSGFDITTEAAVAKLMYLLGQGLSNEEVKQWMQIPLRGELTVDS
ncbi:type I asparaginase [Bacteroidales bacterium OttesenSCG-928-L19]|nr:type I asparaginase [Bacteroidales bacterium OttesenSCG-928-L19]